LRGSIEVENRAYIENGLTEDHKDTVKNNYSSKTITEEKKSGKSSSAGQEFIFSSDDDIPEGI
jgi:hypothetical protein